MKDLYKSPELKIIIFTSMQSVATEEFEGSEGDIYERFPEDEEE